MKILLCAATEREIAPTIQFLAAGEMQGVEVLITGVGLLPATYAITKAMVAHRPSLLLQAGVAGTLRQGDNLTEVVAVGNECLGDAGVWQDGTFQSLFDLRLANASLFPWQDGRLPNANPLLQTTGLRVVNGVTVGEISTRQEMMDLYRHQLQADVETMEGAAVHYVGLSEQVPFLQLRSLSNFIGERDKTKWQLEKAIANLNRYLQQFLIKHQSA